VTTEGHGTKPDVRDAPYALAGTFFEACDCYTICPCWTGSGPDEGACTGIFAWEIQEGIIDGVDVAGLRAASVSQHAGFRGEGAKQRVVMFIDENASQRQSDALVAALTGSLGGPLQELADLLGELVAVEHAPISVRREGRLNTLTVGTRLFVEGLTMEGPSGRPTSLSDGKLSNVLGSPAAAGESWRMRVGLGGHGMELDVRGRSTMSGHFSYEHSPA
jgi:hypothetical protein